MIKVENLLVKLELISLGLSGEGVIDQSDCFVFRKGRIWTYNDDVACSVPVPDGMEDLTCSIPARDFMAVLKKLRKESFKMEVGESDEIAMGELKLRMKNRRMGLRISLDIVLPIRDIVKPSKNGWRKLPDGFWKAIDVVEGCAGHDESMMSYMCIRFMPQGLEAFDNDQGIRYRLNTGLKEALLLRCADVKKVANLGMTHWQEVEGWVHFRGATGIIVSCRRWEADEWIDLAPLLKCENGVECVIPKEVVAAVDKASLLSAKRGMQKRVKVTLKEGQCHIYADGDAGWYEERVEVKGNKQKVSFFIAPKLLKEVSKRSEGCKIDGSGQKLVVSTKEYRYATSLEEV